MVVRVTPDTNELNDPNPVKDEPVIVEPRVQETAPVEVEIVESPELKTTKTKNNTDDLNIEPVELAMGLMGAPIISKRTPEETPRFERDKPSQAEIDETLARDDDFTGVSIAAQTKRQTGELSGNSGNYNGTPGGKKDEEKERREKERQLLQTSLMTVAEFSEAVEKLAEKVETEMDPLVDDVLERGDETIDRLRDRLHKATMEEFERGGALLEGMDSPDPAIRERVNLEYDLAVAKNDLFKEICGKSASELRQDVNELETRRAALKTEIEELREMKRDGKISQEEQNRLNQAEREYSSVMDSARALDAKLDRSDKIMNALDTAFANDNIIDPMELQNLIASTEGNEKARTALQNYATSLEGKISIAGMGTESSSTFWKTQFALFDIERDQRAVEQKLAADPNNAALLEEAEQIRQRRVEFEKQAESCFREDLVHTAMARNQSAEYKRLDAAYGEKVEQYSGLIEGTITVSNSAVYMENGQYHVIDTLTGDTMTLEEYLADRPEQIQGWKDDIARQQTLGRTFASDELKTLTKEMGELLEKRTAAEKVAVEGAFQKSTGIAGTAPAATSRGSTTTVTTSAASQYEAPGEEWPKGGKSLSSTFASNNKTWEEGDPSNVLDPNANKSGTTSQPAANSGVNYA